MLSFKRMSHSEDLYDVIMSEPPTPIVAIVRDFDRNHKTRLAVELKPTDLLRIESIENEVRSQFPNFCSAITGKQLTRINIPTQYGIITLKLKTITDTPLLPEHIVDDVECILTVRPTKLVVKPDKTICTWLCESFVANIKYA